MFLMLNKQGIMHILAINLNFELHVIVRKTGRGVLEILNNKHILWKLIILKCRRFKMVGGMLSIFFHRLMHLEPIPLSNILRKITRPILESSEKQRLWVRIPLKTSILSSLVLRSS